jgi:hypothetical protein
MILSATVPGHLFSKSVPFCFHYVSPVSQVHSAKADIWHKFEDTIAWKYNVPFYKDTLSLKF